MWARLITAFIVHHKQVTVVRALSPVFARFLLENSVAVIHAVLCGDVDACMWVVFHRLPQHVVHNALAILPHVAQGSPHHIDCLIPLAKEVLGFLN